MPSMNCWNSSWKNNEIYLSFQLSTDNVHFSVYLFSIIAAVNDFGIWNLQAIRASTYENFTGPNTYSLARE